MPVRQNGIQGGAMQLRATVSICAICIALVGARYLDFLWARLMPDPEINIAVKDLPRERRGQLMASGIVACLRTYPGETTTSAPPPAAEDFCGCKIENLSRFLNPRELSTGRFDNAQRYIDNAWNVQTVMTKCSHRSEASVSL